MARPFAEATVRLFAVAVLASLGSCRDATSACVPDCATGLVCIDEQCRKACVRHSECPAGESCFEGICQQQRLPCAEDAMLGQVCDGPDSDRCAHGRWSCSASGETLVCAADVPEAEVCDGLDNDCDGSVDEDYPDTDGDGLADCIDDDDDGDGCADAIDRSPLVHSADGDRDTFGADCDCNDDDRFVNPGTGVDSDGDGFGTSCDCRDDEKSINPLALEVCDGIDNDCDAGVDEGFADTDGNGVADCVDPDDDGDGCLDSEDEQPLVAHGNSDGDSDPDDCDCAPDRDDIHRGAVELCDGLDNDCDGLVDGADDSLVVPAAVDTCPDMIPNGVCADHGVRLVCGGIGPAWRCEGLAPEFEPVEVSCDGLDNDCDGAADDGLDPAALPAALNPCRSYGTYGVCGAAKPVCSGASGWQCDLPANYEPMHETTCDGIDNDCDNSPDEEDHQIYEPTTAPGALKRPLLQGYSRTQYIYPAEALALAGAAGAPVTRIGLHLNAPPAGDGATYGQYDVKIRVAPTTNAEFPNSGGTPTTTLSTNIVGATLVYDHTNVEVQGLPLSWAVFPLDTPFTVDPSAHLIIEITATSTQFTGFTARGRTAGQATSVSMVHTTDSGSDTPQLASSELPDLLLLYGCVP